MENHTKEEVEVKLNVCSLGPNSLVGAVVSALDKLEDRGLGCVHMNLVGILNNVDDAPEQMLVLADNLSDLATYLKRRTNQRSAIVEIWFGGGD
jgi:hypothetical protein